VAEDKKIHQFLFPSIFRDGYLIFNGLCLLSGDAAIALSRDTRLTTACTRPRIARLSCARIGRNHVVPAAGDAGR
jgi:hypothetical protein